MDWTVDLIRYWCSRYYELKEYELNPFEETGIFMNEYYVHGSRPHSAPYEDTVDLNIEFDHALDALGSKKERFKRLYIDGQGEDKQLFKEFCLLLGVK